MKRTKIDRMVLSRVILKAAAPDAGVNPGSVDGWPLGAARPDSPEDGRTREGETEGPARYLGNPSPNSTGGCLAELASSSIRDI
jgi:hypothetical protein